MSERNRILFASDIPDFGGGEAFLLSHALRLAEDGDFDPVVTVPGPGLFADRLARTDLDWRILPLRPPCRVCGILPWFPFTDTLRLRRVLVRERIALIHANSFPCALHAGWAAAGLDLPVLWSCHGWGFRSDGWKGRFLRKRMGRILAVSEWTRRKILAPGVVPDSRVQVVYPGVDTDRFRPLSDDMRRKMRERCGAEEGDVLLGIAGTIYPLKRHAFLIDCLEAAQAALPEVRLRLAVVGEGVPGGSPDEMAVRQRARDSALADRIRFLGRQWEMESFYGAFDIYACPSRVESFGLAVTEAMACGVPVIATREGGPSETVVPGETGRLLAPDDRAGWIDAIRTLAASPDQRTEMGGRARERVVAHFSQNIQEELLRQAYADVLSP